MKVDENNQKMLAGVCLGCAETCHKNHDLLELYSKRNFCCDCGNDKFKNFTCTLFKVS